MKLPAPLLLLALLAGLPCTPAQAQWQWIDRNGRPVFSDRPPPTDIPAKDIRKQPAARSTASQPVTPSPAAAGPGAGAAPVIINGTAPVAAASGEDKTLTARKLQAEQAEAAKRRAEEARLAQLQADSCARARQARAGLDAGLRVARTNAKGEREFLDEAGIAAEKQRIDAVIASDCQ